MSTPASETRHNGNNGDTTIMTNVYSPVPPFLPSVAALAASEDLFGTLSNLPGLEGKFGFFIDPNLVLEKLKTTVLISENMHSVSLILILNK